MSLSIILHFLFSNLKKKLGRGGGGGNESIQLLSDIQTKPPAPCRRLPAGERQGRGQIWMRVRAQPELWPGLSKAPPKSEPC